MTEKETQRSVLDRCKIDPFYHLRLVQGVKSAEPYQSKILKAIIEYPRIAVSSCHDMGKTWLAAKIVLWFMSTFPGAKVITTAPTARQVRLLLWSEIVSGYEKSKYPLGGRMLLTEWKIRPDWFALGFTSGSEAGSASGQGSASSFQGFHGDHILVVFDEATGIKPSIWIQVEGILTSGSTRFFAIGNPTTKACEFFRCFSDPAFKKFYLSCFESPNLQANGIFNKEDLQKEINLLKSLPQEERFTRINHHYKCPKPKLISMQWVMSMVLKNGMTHPLVVSKCFGEFPDEDKNTLISLGAIQLAQNRRDSIVPPLVTERTRISIGADIARFGSDDTVITVLQDEHQIMRKTFSQADTMATAGQIIALIKTDALAASKDIRIAIDATGVGGGVVDALNEAYTSHVLPGHVEIRECHFGGIPCGKNSPSKEYYQSKYVNLKARIFVELAEDLKSELGILNEDIYAEELPTIQFRFDSKGRYQIESKDEYTARTGRSSPDHSDSLALANYARKASEDYADFTDNLVQNRGISTISKSRMAKKW